MFGLRLEMHHKTKKLFQQLIAFGDVFIFKETELFQLQIAIS